MAKPTKRDQVFISYSHKDKKIFDKLQTSLKPLIRANQISVWDDTKIKSGDEWRGEIQKAIASAKVAVLLVSPDFIASDFIAEHELPPLLEAAQNEGLIILWIAARFSMYEETEISRYQAVNEPARPLANISGANREKELVRICKEIKSAVLETATEHQRTTTNADQEEETSTRSENIHASEQAQRGKQEILQGMIPKFRRRRMVMSVAAQALFALAAIGAIIIGILLYYHKQSPTVWVTFASVVAVTLAFCLQWQEGIWKSEEAAKERETARTVPPPDATPSVITSPTPTLPTHPDVETAKKKLGKPRRGKKPEMAYQARHDNAMIIWIDGHQDFFVLHRNQKLTTIRGEDVDDDTWFFDEENRKKTGTPEGKDPPYGTFAMAWMSNREWWEREVGWRAWHCQYTKGIVRVQWFEHGLIVGDLRRVKEDYRVAVYVLLTDEGMWSLEAPERRPPPCEKPATNEADFKRWLEKHPRY